MKKILCLFFAVAFPIIDSHAQVPAQWNNTYSSISTQNIALSSDGESVVVWGFAVDSICLSATPALIVIDTSGNISIDTMYELNFCADEMPRAFAPNTTGDGYFLITENNVITPADSSYVYYIDSNLAIQWSRYIGQTLRSTIEPYTRHNYISSDNNAQVRQILRFDQQGMLDTLNAVTLPYFSQAPRIVLLTNGLVFEIGNRLNLDSAFVCLIYDTSGTYVNSFSFDADNTLDEVPYFAGISGNQIFHVTTNSPYTTYPASSDLVGATQWVDTLYHEMQPYDGACIDTVNDVGFVMCRGASSRSIFSYDLQTGMRLDSIIIDSVDISVTGIKSGPAGGVYFVYDKRYSNQVAVEQYDAGLNLIWTGYAEHPTCVGNCRPEDFLIDSVGNVFAVSYCSSCTTKVMVSKFGPSLVSVPSIETNAEGMKLFPSPANTEVTIGISDDNCTGGVITVLDATGKILKSNSFFGNSCSLLTEEFSSGLYFIKVTTDSGLRFTQKLIIQHP